MARLLKDSPYYGKSGTFDQFVLRQLHGETIVQAVGRRPRTPPTAAQRKQRELMYQSRCYGKAQSDDPAAKALYATGICERFRNAYAVAARDYRNAPEITALDASGYQGQVGDPIRVLATDDFGVVAVVVRLLAPDGSLREAGPATEQADGSWLYRATQPGPVVAGTLVVAKAHDRPGNVKAEQQML